jgi:hypothetical protein
MFGKCPGCEAKDAEIGRQQAIIQRLMEHNVRIDRKLAGLPELEAQPRKPREPMPADVREYIRSWSNPVTREDLERRANSMYDKYRDWTPVTEFIAQHEAGILSEEEE